MNTNIVSDAFSRSFWCGRKFFFGCVGFLISWVLWFSCISWAVTSPGSQGFLGSFWALGSLWPLESYKLQDSWDPREPSDPWDLKDPGDPWDSRDQALPTNTDYFFFLKIWAANQSVSMQWREVGGVSIETKGRFKRTQHLECCIEKEDVSHYCITLHCRIPGVKCKAW